MTLSLNESLLALGGRLGCNNPAMHGLLYQQPGYVGLAGLAGRGSKGALAMVQQQFAEAESAYNAALPQAERAVSSLNDVANKLSALAMQAQTAAEGRTSVGDYVDQVVSAAEHAHSAAPLASALREAKAHWTARYNEAKAGSQNVLTIADAKPMQDLAQQATGLDAELEGTVSGAQQAVRQITQQVASEKRREEDAARAQADQQARADAEAKRIADEQAAAHAEAQRLADLQAQREQAQIDADRQEREQKFQAEQAARDAARQDTTAATQAELEWRKYQADQQAAQSDAVMQLELKRLDAEEAARQREEARMADKDQLETLIKLVGAGLLPKEAVAAAFGVQQQAADAGYQDASGNYLMMPPQAAPAPAQASPFMYPPQPPAVVAPQSSGIEFDQGFTPGGQMFGMNGLLYQQPGYQGLANPHLRGLLYQQPGYEGLAGMGELVPANHAGLPPGAQVEQGYAIYYHAESPGNFKVIVGEGTNKTRSFMMTYRQANEPGAKVRDPVTAAVFYTTPESPEDGGPKSALSSFVDTLGKVADKGAEVYGKVLDAKRGGGGQPQGGGGGGGVGIGTMVVGGLAALGIGWGAYKLAQRVWK